MSTETYRSSASFLGLLLGLCLGAIALARLTISDSEPEAAKGLLVLRIRSPDSKMMWGNTPPLPLPNGLTENRFATLPVLLPFGLGLQS